MLNNTVPLVTAAFSAVVPVAEQTRLIAEAIKNDGQPAINYEIMKRQVDGLAEVAASNQTKTLVVPTDITKAVGTLELFLDSLDKGKKNDA